jgi:hypothetical protein
VIDHQVRRPSVRTPTTTEEQNRREGRIRWPDAGEASALSPDLLRGDPYGADVQALRALIGAHPLSNPNSTIASIRDR